MSNAESCKTQAVGAAELESNENVLNAVLKGQSLLLYQLPKLLLD